MLDGKVAEIGSYAELMAAEGALAKLVQEHVADPHQAEDGEDEINPQKEREGGNDDIAGGHAVLEQVIASEKKGSTTEEGALMLKEERQTGALVSRARPRSVQSGPSGLD